MTSLSTVSRSAAQDTWTELLGRVRREIQKAVLGQDDVIDQVLWGFLAGGHVLIEGLPGLGKTLLVRALAKTFGGQAQRVQFTPDLMPADISGHVLYDVRTGEFRTHKGPIFTNLLLADEINRAPAKTQAAMLEAMQEGQVTLDGTTHRLPQPFMTLATQNPLEHEGTYPLPDAQLDRFLLEVRIDYPDEAREVDIVRQVTSGLVDDALSTDGVETLLRPEDVLALRRHVASLQVVEPVIAYAVAIARATRGAPALSQGAGPRGGLALVRLSRAAAFLAGRDYVIPDDVKQVAVPALRHRVVLAPETELEGRGIDEVLATLLETVEAPR